MDLFRVNPKEPDLPPRAEALLSQSDWVRAVVRGLGVDRSVADDVVQSTWVAALSRPPRDAENGASLRAWIARVARNFALRRIDREARRASHERESAKEERLPSASDVVEREEARAQVVRALLEVHEPFRTTLLLRYYEGLEPRDIARLQKVPDSTVRNRLKRGLAMLRERLEISQGAGWRQRCLLVLPALRAKPVGILSVPKTVAASAASGGVLVIKSVGIAAAVAVAAGGAYLAWNRVEQGGMRRSNPSVAVHVEAGPGSGSAGGSATSGAHARDARDRAASHAGAPQLVAASPVSARAPASGAAEGASEATEDGRRCRLRGKLLSPDGEPLKPSPAPVGFRFMNMNRIRDELVVRALERLDVPSGGPAKGDEAVVESKQALDPSPVEVTVDRRDPAPAGGERKALDLTLLSRVTNGAPAEGEAKVEADSFFLPRYSAGIAIGGSPSRGPHVLISSTEGDAREVDVDAGGGFEFGDLRPGPWHLFATAPGYQARRMDFAIAEDQAEKQLDVTLAPMQRLRVKLSTPDGRDLNQAVIDDPALGETFAPIPFATRGAPGPRIADTGAWHARGEGEESELGDASGFLELEEALPLHVGFAVCGTVVEQRLVQPGSEEVVFVVPLDRIRALPGSVAVRILSARDGQPIAGASIHIEGVAGAESGPDGVAEIARVPPGLREIHFQAEGMERSAEWIRVEPGARTDLGARDVGPARKIPGRVVDENGTAVQVNVKLVAVDGRAPDRALPLVEMVATDDQGRFTFESAGRRRYLLSIEGHDWAAPVQSVDARGGIPDEIVVHAAQVGELKQTFPIEPPPGSVYVVESDALGGLPVAVEPAEGWRPLCVRLGNGDYKVRLVCDGRTLWTRGIKIEPGQMIAFDLQK